MQGYTDTILKYAAQETHIGLLDTPDGTGEVGLSGQEMGKKLAVRFTLNLESNHIKDIRFQVFGCGFTIAACAAAAELSQGKPLQEICRYTPATIDQLLGGLPEERSYCADLANQALQAAIASAQSQSAPVQQELNPHVGEEHGVRLSAEDPLYQTLLAAAASELDEDDRQLFAALIALANQEPFPLNQALGLEKETLAELFAEFFPSFQPASLQRREAEEVILPPEVNPDILGILLTHVPCDATGGRNRTAEWLARIIAARAAHPGHLWCAMGFFERPRLTAAIRRHLPTLAAANNQGMRWKRYLFKQVCDLNGGTMCKSPNCGDCSDYPLCFAPEDD